MEMDSAEQFSLKVAAFRSLGRLCLKSADDLTFGLALEVAREGLKIARREWSGSGLFLKAEVGEINSKTPCLYRCMDGDKIAPWRPSQGDLYSDD